MKSKMMFLITAMMILAVPMFAAEGTSSTAAVANWWVPITAGFAMAIASSFCALSQGRAIAAAAEGMARNPAASDAIRGALILGLALIESLALFTFAMIFAKVQ
jgi:F-type H+-transporting ATPase subunit c